MDERSRDEVFFMAFALEEARKAYNLGGNSYRRYL